MRVMDNSSIGEEGRKEAEELIRFKNGRVDFSHRFENR